MTSLASLHSLQKASSLLKYGSPPGIHRALIIIKLYGDWPEDLRAQIQTPGYPLNYPNNSNFAWLIHTRHDYKLTFEMTDLDAEPCCDRVTVHDGDNFPADVLAELTGTLLSNTSSTGNTMLIHFESDSQRSRRGFQGFVHVLWNLLHQTLSVVIDNEGSASENIGVDFYLELHSHVLSFELVVDKPHGVRMDTSSTRPAVRSGLCCCCCFACDLTY